MTDRPISFKAPMIRALLNGSKTQTRRLIKPQPPEPVVRHGWYDAPLYGFTGGDIPSKDWHIVRLLAQKGDRLWVKEAWRAQRYFDDKSPTEIGQLFTEERGDPYAPVFYEATKECDGSSVEQWQQSSIGRLRASMHMPRWASRLTLTVTDVRVQRLQDISCADAIAEGIPPSANSMTIDCDTPDPREDFASLWC